MSLFKGKEKYRGVFEIQKSGDKTSSGEIGLDIRTHASPKVGQDQDKLLSTTVQIFIPIYQQIWILQIFSRFSRFLA